MTGGPNDEELISGINVVPLVDIVLVLLIIFMVTASFLARPAIDMELPRADTADRRERDQFSLLLGKDGSVALGSRRIDPRRIGDELRRVVEDYERQLARRLRAEGRPASALRVRARARDELTMVVQADRSVSHGRVIYFIDEARKRGILKYAFDVEPAPLAAK